MQICIKTETKVSVLIENQGFIEEQCASALKMQRRIEKIIQYGIYVIFWQWLTGLYLTHQPFYMYF